MTKPIYLDEKFILLSPEIAVPEDLVARLSHWGFDQVFSEGQITAEPAATVRGFLDPDTAKRIAGFR